MTGGLPNTVALFVQKGGRGTWANITLAMARGLKDVGIPSVHLVRLKERPQLAAQVPEGVRIVELPVHRSTYASWSLGRYLRRARPELTIATGAGFMNVAAISGWLVSGRVGALVVWDQNALSFKALEHRDSFRMRAVPRLARTLYPHATGVTAVSSGVLEDVNRLVGGKLEPRRQAVIPNAIDMQQCRARSREEVSEPWFDDDVPVLLAVSRPAPQKDVPTLIRALDRVRRRRAVRLVILGDGPERRRIIDLIHRLGLESQVRLVGTERNPYRYMSRATCLVLPSQEEGFGLVVPEALACRLPVVATACAGPTETLRSVGVGVLSPIGDADALGEAILYTLETIDARRREVREADLSRFAPRSVAERWLEFYQRVCK